jgi:citrate-Mg2+:H+ or citrate-Ca2+:H+ symporter, CitMHS family
MLAVTGFITILAVLVAIMSKRASPLVALIMIPSLAAILLGEGLALPGYLISGVTNIAPIAVMFIFAILFFGLMNQARVFDPLIRLILRICKDDPRKLFVGVALITALVHLDGSGASTFLIVVPAVLPVFQRLNLDPKILTCVVAMSAGVNNMLPWGGPTIRAAAALDVPVMDMYWPLIPAHLTGFIVVLLISFYLGVRERRRIQPLGGIKLTENDTEDKGVQRAIPVWRWSLNLVLIGLVVVMIVGGFVPPMVAFIFASLFALCLNFPHVDKQVEQIDKQAKPAFMMASILFAAGCFTGVLKGSGMLDAMAQGGGNMLPDSMVQHMPLLVAVLSMPLSLLFDPDSFYFGIMPVLAGIAGEAGLAPVSVAHSALLGQMTTGFPVSPLTPATFLLVGLAGVNLAEHQRFSIPLLMLLSLVMTLVCVLTGVIPV